jgi:Double-GTPase 2
MDDLILILLGAMLFAVVATVALFAAAAVLGAAMLGTTLWAFVEGLAAFTGDFKASVLTRGGQRRSPQDPEPAFELYVLGQVFADFRHALEHAAGILGTTRGQIASWSAKYQKGATWPVAVGAIVGGYVGTLFAGALGVLCGVAVAMVVGVVAGISWVLIWLLRLADVLRRRIRHASYECPTDHERFALPIYLCPACGAEHHRLVPGRWGIFKRECKCGRTALPTTVIGGRQRVPQQCPAGHLMSGFLGFAENLPIAIVGGPSAGKSTFLAGALVELESPDAGVYIEPLSESRDAYSRLIEAMRTGVAPEKTVDEQRPALVAEIQGSGRSRALYAYDLAGEVYSAEDKVRGLRFLERSAGIVLLVDPFSIQHVAEDRAAELAAEASRVLPSSEDPMRVYERLLATLKEAGVQTQEMPLAVVIAKSDAFGVQQEIDALAVAEKPGTGEHAWLEQNGAGNLVRSIEQDFKHVGWFSLSALGRMPDPANKTPFAPRGALAPLLWILKRRNVHPSPQAATAPHTAQRLVGSASDFPPPSARARARNAGLITASGALALLAGLIVLIASASGGAKQPTLAGIENVAASSPASSEASSGSSEAGSGSGSDEASSTTGEASSGETSSGSTETGEADATTGEGDEEDEGGPTTSTATEAGSPSGQGGETSTPEGTEPAATQDLASLTRGNDFTIQRPSGDWVLDHDEVAKPGYIETRWHLAGEPKVLFLVDHTPGFSGTAEEGAEGVSKSFSRVSSYRELDFSATQLPAGDAWRWEYEVDGQHSVDTFLMSCNTGYAARGAAPAGQWSHYAQSFEDATATLTPTCE